MSQQHSTSKIVLIVLYAMDRQSGNSLVHLVTSHIQRIAVMAWVDFSSVRRTDICHFLVAILCINFKAVVIDSYLLEVLVIKTFSN